MEKKKIVRVTKDDFELSDGSVHPHVIFLEEVPTIEEFQAQYDYWFNYFQEFIDEPEDAIHRTSCTAS